MWAMQRKQYELYVDPDQGPGRAQPTVSEVFLGDLGLVNLMSKS